MAQSVVLTAATWRQLTSVPAPARRTRRDGIVWPAVGWADLVLPPDPFTQLRELTARARRRDRILGAWGMRSVGSEVARLRLTADHRYGVRPDRRLAIAEVEFFGHR